MRVTVHTCPNTWFRLPGHPCTDVLRALDDAGIEYRVVKHPWRRSNRPALIELTGQHRLPVIEFDDGSVYRAESSDMVAVITGRGLEAKRASGPLR